jgi:tRNA-dihydrouridine synthase
VRDWASGQAIDTIGLRSSVVEHMQQLTSIAAPPPWEHRRVLPVSVKTRLGYDSVVVEDWVSTLLEERPAAITIHGRTLEQMYRGRADWDAIRRAAKLVRETSSLVLGNGDVATMSEAVQRVRETQVHGVLIGRGALGNPWIFRAKAWARQQFATPTAEAPSLDVAVCERCQVALEHARYFEGLNDGVPFQAMRKHLGWYCRGFPGAAEMRAQLFTTTSSGDVAQVFVTRQGVGPTTLWA